MPSPERSRGAQQGREANLSEKGSKGELEGGFQSRFTLASAGSSEPAVAQRCHAQLCKALAGSSLIAASGTGVARGCAAEALRHHDSRRGAPGELQSVPCIPCQPAAPCAMEGGLRCQCGVRCSESLLATSRSCAAGRCYARPQASIASGGLGQWVEDRSGKEVYVKSDDCIGAAAAADLPSSKSSNFSWYKSQGTEGSRAARRCRRWGGAAKVCAACRPGRAAPHPQSTNSVCK